MERTRKEGRVGDLTKELLKAGLIDEKQAREAAHQKRVKRKKVGVKGLDAEEQGARRAEEERRDRAAASDRERNRREHDAGATRRTRAELKNLVKDGAVTQGTNGNRRFYFVARDGRCPFLAVNDETVRRLTARDLVIVEVPDLRVEQFVLLPRQKAERVKADAPELIRSMP